jgi:ubiquitin carboxyl-terminal hydrolase 8
MSRSLPSPPLSSLPFSQIQQLATYPEHITDFSPKEWFDRARHETDLAIIAERKNKKEEMFIAYSKAFSCYYNAKVHPEFGEVKKSDPVWGNRVKDFKEVSD